MTTFNIIENHDLFDDFPYESLKKDYMDMNIPVIRIKKKYGVTNSRKWTKILRKLRSENVPMRFKARDHDPKYYYYAKDCKKYVVRRVINKKLIYYGRYSTEEEAKARVQELKANGWQK